MNTRISEGKSKRVVYEAARGIIPQSILERKKQPFTLPITAMIRADSKLFEFMQSVFSDRRFRDHGFFDAEKVLGYCKLQTASPRDDVANMLWSAMSFELWHRHIDAVNLTLDPRRNLLPIPIGLQKKL
ncbi:MAG: asparagine synthase-related protein [Hyphomicrobium sp.]